MRYLARRRASGPDRWVTGDPHMDLVKVSGAAPENATKMTHGPIRELYKTRNFGTLYGQGIWGLARRSPRATGPSPKTVPWVLGLD